MEKQTLTKKEFLKVINKLPLKVKVELLSVIMDKYQTVDYNKVKLEDLVSELEIIVKRRLLQIQPFIEATNKNLQKLNLDHERRN
jgi:Ca2+-binding EF-hand superfamily protein